MCPCPLEDDGRDPAERVYGQRCGTPAKDSRQSLVRIKEMSGLWTKEVWRRSFVLRLSRLCLENFYVAGEFNTFVNLLT